MLRSKKSINHHIVRQSVCKETNVLGTNVILNFEGIWHLVRNSGKLDINLNSTWIPCTLLGSVFSVFHLVLFAFLMWHCRFNFLKNPSDYVF